MYRHSISVRIKNGCPDLSDDPEVQIPPVLFQCEQLWEGRGRRKSWSKDQWAFVRASVEPLLYATIDPEDVHYENGLLNTRGTIRTELIELSSCSFENGPVPIVSAYARFELSFDRQFADTEQFYAWQEKTDWLDWATNLGWQFEVGSEYDAGYDNTGIEFEVLTL